MLIFLKNCQIHDTYQVILHKIQEKKGKRISFKAEVLLGYGLSLSINSRYICLPFILASSILLHVKFNVKEVINTFIADTFIPNKLVFFIINTEAYCS